MGVRYVPGVRPHSDLEKCRARRSLAPMHEGDWRKSGSMPGTWGRCASAGGRGALDDSHLGMGMGRLAEYLNAWARIRRPAPAPPHATETIERACNLDAWYWVLQVRPEGSPLPPYTPCY